MTARPSPRGNSAATIIHDAIEAYKSRLGLLRKNLSRRQRHEIGEAKINYARGILSEEAFRRAVEQALTGVDAPVSPPPSDITR